MSEHHLILKGTEAWQRLLREKGIDPSRATLDQIRAYAAQAPSMLGRRSVEQLLDLARANLDQLKTDLSSAGAPRPSAPPASVRRSSDLAALSLPTIGLGAELFTATPPDLMALVPARAEYSSADRVRIASAYREYLERALAEVRRLRGAHRRLLSRLAKQRDDVLTSLVQAFLPSLSPISIQSAVAATGAEELLSSDPRGAADRERRELEERRGPVAPRARSVIEADLADVEAALSRARSPLDPVSSVADGALARGGTGGSRWWKSAPRGNDEGGTAAEALLPTSRDHDAAPLPENGAVRALGARLDSLRKDHDAARAEEALATVEHRHLERARRVLRAYLSAADHGMLASRLVHHGQEHQFAWFSRLFHQVRALEQLGAQRLPILQSVLLRERVEVDHELVRARSQSSPAVRVPAADLERLKVRAQLLHRIGRGYTGAESRLAAYAGFDLGVPFWTIDFWLKLIGAPLTSTMAPFADPELDALAQISGDPRGARAPDSDPLLEDPPDEAEDVALYGDS